VLEQIRLLTNLETNERKLLRIILLGQPELAEVLDRREMRQLAQRVTARYHLAALDPDETRAYIAHRLTLAGGSANLFTAAASRRVHQLSGGIPRLINVIADRALLGAYVEGKPRVRASVVTRAGQEILGRRVSTRHWLAAALGVAALVGVAWGYFKLPDESAAPRLSSQPAPAQRVQSVASAADSAIALPAEAARTQHASLDVPTPAPAASSAVTPAAPTSPTAVEANDSRASSTDLGRPPGLSATDTQHAAYARVFERWGQPMDDSDIPCNVAAHVGLQCLRDTGGWSSLVRINRPAVLELWDDSSQPFYGAALQMNAAKRAAVLCE
jgi:general secretion pathway protein A